MDDFTHIKELQYSQVAYTCYIDGDGNKHFKLLKNRETGETGAVEEDTLKHIVNKTQRLKVEVLGNNGAFSDDNTSFLIDDKILIDCSDSIVKKLIKEDRLDDIKEVFITHKHMDHIGGLETLLFYKLARTGFNEEVDIKVYLPADAKRLYDEMHVSSYDHMFKGVIDIKEDITRVYLDNVIIVPEKLTHYHGQVEAYGYSVENRTTGGKVFFTGDVDNVVLKSPKEYCHVFHDAGWTNLHESKRKCHPTETEIVQKYKSEYGHCEHVVPVHTSSELEHMRLPRVSEIFKF